MQSRLCPVHGCSREEGKEGKRGLKKKGRGAVGLKYRIKESEKAKEKKFQGRGKEGDQVGMHRREEEKEGWMGEWNERDGRMDG